MLSEMKIKALIKLVKDGRITIAEIKDQDYKTEVENRMG